MVYRKTWRAMLTLVVVALFAGCATVQSTNPEDVVKARASERWSALVKGDVTVAYAFMSPGYRAVVAERDFASRRGNAVRLASATVAGVNCSEAEKCVVTVRLESKPLMGGRFGDLIATHIEEIWLLEEGRWWLFEKV